MFNELTISRKFQFASTLTLLFFLFRIVYTTANSLTLLSINELIALFSFYFWHLYVYDFLRAKRYNPISLVVNSGIFAAVLLFLYSFSTNIFSVFPSDVSTVGFLNSVLLLIFGLIPVGITVYIFSAFRVLSGFRQKSAQARFFNALLVFLFLTAVANSYTHWDQEGAFVRDAFYIVAIILAALNSIRVSWIAFLKKRQKVNLFIISIFIIAIFGVNYGVTFGYDFFNQTLTNTSPGLHRILNITMIYGLIYFVVIFFTTLFHLPTAEAFDKRSEEINSLKDFSKLITRVFDFSELAETITSITTKVYAADAAWLLTKDDKSFALRAVNRIGHREAESISNLILNRFKDNLHDIIETSDNELLPEGAHIGEFRFKSFAVVPLNLHNEISGYLFAARQDDNRFEEGEKTALSAYADYASVALENANLIHESIEKERLEKELEVAREIQHKILPAETPDCPNLEISALFIPAFEVGGDYYDFFRLKKNKIGFVIADVSGKGISAAFIMAEVKGVFESLSKTITGPNELLTKANEILNSSLDKKTFVTAVYGVIDVETGEVVFARAGHTPVHLYTNGKAKRLVPKGMGLGLNELIKFSESLEEMEIQLNINDILVLYSDGIIEAQNSAGEEFGYGRLDELVLKNTDNSAGQLSKMIIREVSAFSKDRAQHDDITLVIFKRTLNNN